MPANGLRQRELPNYALYGAEAAQSSVDIVHHERIPSRAGRFDFDITPHFHDTLIQALYVTHSSGEATIDGKVWAFNAPCLIVVPARSVHGFRFCKNVDGHVMTAAQSAIESVAITVAPELLTFVRTPAVLTVDPASRCGEPLETLFEAIGREAERPERWQFTAGLALAITLFVQIARLSEKARLAGNPARAALAARIERFRTLLDERCRTRRPVASYANAMGVTPGQLTRICREAFGISAIEAIDRRAIHEAKRLLGYSSFSVKQIAGELGFRDEAYFGRFFRKQTGLRPTEYRIKEQSRLSLYSPNDANEP
ncbi:helix-turn-helix domain-containing protein [Raoultella sp. RIT712]|uniref:helix-turn-helix domain-containing protein n=1 Tax=Raoultella sp. RIT712 TaxID=2666191 RepID=UPI0012AD9A06|nr:helix-turn-helix domain-containing protein [Raoultella sp. RIT712]MRT49351.1 helix-turn-helix domain-containing protein [Raoultella sp. RIT712]